MSKFQMHMLTFCLLLCSLVLVIDHRVGKIYFLDVIIMWMLSLCTGMDCHVNQQFALYFS